MNRTRSARELKAAMRRAPIAALSALVGKGPVMVLAPHPDDEAFGCGGLIAACAAAKVPVHVFFVTDGSRSHEGSTRWPPERVARRRAIEAARACRWLGVPIERVAFLGAPDGELAYDYARIDRLGRRLGRAARALRARAVFATWDGEPHPDHAATAALAKLVQRAHPPIRLRYYPIWAQVMEPGEEVWTWPRAIGRADVRRRRGAKTRAIAAHRTQVTKLIADGPSSVAPTDRKPFLSGWEPYFLVDRWPRAR